MPGPYGLTGNLGCREASGLLCFCLAMEKVRAIRITRWREDEAEELEDLVVREAPLTIQVNGQELATLLCSPYDLRELTLGFLLSEGILKPSDPVPEVEVNEPGGYAQVTLARDLGPELSRTLSRLVGSGCAALAAFYRGADARDARPIQSRLLVTRPAIWALMKAFQAKSELYRRTGGLHAVALATAGGEMVAFHEDIGRHNALDRIIGRAYLQRQSLCDRIALTSGRLTSEIVVKAAKAEIPILISRSAPTDLAVGLAEKLSLTLVGFVRGKRLNIYSGAERVR